MAVYRYRHWWNWNNNLPKDNEQFPSFKYSAVSAAGTYQIKVRDANFRFCDCS
jgi:hypothetical protein